MCVSKVSESKNEDAVDEFDASYTALDTELVAAMVEDLKGLLQQTRDTLPEVESTP